ncbi:hypothetical protein HDU79_008876 [Rhizoclosmatium sp. JEL0117]|nr:hypothetical protein HDU79_008876 [Rhizoclosmatium sp. JEL0117]
MSQLQPPSYQQPRGTQENSQRLQKSYKQEVPLQTNQQNSVYESCLGQCGDCCGFLGMFPCLPCFPNPYKAISQGTVGLVTRFGRYYKCVDPGLVRINPYTEKIRAVDIKVNITPIPSQVIMTGDNVSIVIDSVIYWEIVDPFIATFLVSNVNKALMERTQTTLRHVVGSRSLQESIENRDSLAKDILSLISGPAKSWGVQVESILIKDIKFTPELQETLAAAAKQQRIGESKIITARSELESAKLMREASDILNTKAAMQIRYLETLASISTHPGTKIVFLPPGADN